ncbi:MAG: DUF5004 domain-containing protein [Spirochaetaceae bacterium]|nr:DUF5004 domain-containing protein [Spirochaetaceae bacterium]
MKKGIAITLALVMMVLFVGCGLANQLEGTKWEMSETVDGATEKLVFNFQEESKLVLTVSYSMPEYDIEESFSMSGSWSVDGDQLTISYTDGVDTITETATAEIDGDKLTLTVTEDGETEKVVLTRVK